MQLSRELRVEQRQDCLVFVDESDPLILPVKGPPHRIRAIDGVKSGIASALCITPSIHVC